MPLDRTLCTGARGTRTKKLVIAAIDPPLSHHNHRTCIIYSYWIEEGLHL